MKGQSVSAAHAKKKHRPGVPTREDVLAFIAENPGLAGKRELARAFGVKGHDRVVLKQLLRDMTADGLLEKRRKRLTRPEDLPSVCVLQVYGRDEDGELLAVPKRWDEKEKGPPPVVLLPSASGKKRRGAEPGVSDQVLARVERLGDHKLARYRGRVIKVLEKRQSATLGVVEKGSHGFRVLPVDRRQSEMLLDRDDTEKVQPGDLIAVEQLERRPHGLGRVKLVERVGSLRDEKAISLIAIHRHQIPHRFGPASLDAANALQPIDLNGRTDWRDRPLITIDPPDAKDHDDAVQAEPDPDPNNPGGHIVRVAIADVAAYVRPGTAFDREALERGNSVYFPDRVVPMLPERISNDLCSLRPDEDRPALAVEMVFDKHGIKQRHRFYRVAMRSHARLSYAAAQAAIDGHPDEQTENLLQTVLQPLWDAYRSLAEARNKRSPLDLDLPERKIALTPEGTVDRIVTPPRLDAHRLIEEFMIQANVAAAETLEEKRSPVIYRVHNAPSLEKLDALRTFLSSLDLSFPKQGAMRPSHFNGILTKVRDSDQEEAVNEIVLRSQSQAEYNPANIGHFGLNLRRYAHFTSPIRRYADLIVHRALISALNLGRDGLPPDAERQFATIATDISAAERRAMAAERETVDRLIAGWLADRVGATFEGRISGVTTAGLFIRLKDTGADGFVPISSLGAEYFIYEEHYHRLVGEKTGATFRIGHPVEVRLVDALPLAGALRFEIVSEAPERTRGARPKPARRPERRGRKRF
ncbi:MAG: ribonuclease R [Pseudomonadota bacterium]